VLRHWGITEDQADLSQRIHLWIPQHHNEAERTLSAVLSATDQEAMQVKATWLVKMIKPKTEVLVIDLCAGMLLMMVLPKPRQTLHVLRDIRGDLLALLASRLHGSESLRLEEQLH